MNIPYASQGEKIKDSNTPQLKWPLIGGVLISSDTTRLGPEGKQATYIDEKYQNDAGDKISVSKALYPDGYRSISILNNGQEFNQGYRPDGSINYTVTPEQFKKDTTNYLDYTRPIPKGQKGLNGGIQPGVYYVNFPDQQIYVKNQVNRGKGFFGKLANGVVDLFDGREDDGRWGLGHAGVMTVDANGGTQYYEYGRYGTKDGKLVGKNVGTSTYGNWRRKSVPNAVITNGEIDHEATAKRMSAAFGAQPVELTFVDNADPKKTLAAINADASDKHRDKYNLLNKTCGSEACSVIDAGQSGWEQFMDGVKRAGNAVNPFNFRTSPFRAVFGGFTPSAKREGLEAAGYRTYSSK